MSSVAIAVASGCFFAFFMTHISKDEARFLYMALSMVFLFLVTLPFQIFSPPLPYPEMPSSTLSIDEATARIQ